jgi:hypothetical protein
MELMEQRRSRRSQFAAPVLIQSLDPLFDFTVRGVMVEVSPHGCQIRAPRPFMNGARLSLRLVSSNILAAARVVRSIPSESHMATWNVALELCKPSGPWGKVCSESVKFHVQAWRGRLRSFLFPV